MLLNLFKFFLVVSIVVAYNDTISDNPSCAKCRSIVNDLIQKRRAGGSREDLYKDLNDLCNQYMYGGSTYCAGLVEVNLDTALYIIDNKIDLAPSTVCGSYLQYLNCQDDFLGQWEVNLPEYSPSKTNKSKCNSTRIVEVEDSQKITKLRVLHITDIHVDPTYLPGSNSMCMDLPICCQNSTGPAPRPEDAAGLWGSYNMCDIPWTTVLEALSHITKQHTDIDIVYYTGDVVSHINWATTKEGNADLIKQIHRQLKATFGDIPVYPVLGNHDSHPADCLAPTTVIDPLVSSQWLYDLLAQEWSTWLPKTKTVHQGGYYTTLIKPKLRIIGINSNICYINNLWLIYDDKDPLNQLQWLVDILHHAEREQESVHIISHIPAGESLCSKHWIHQYNRVIKRFAKTIKAQITGHSHLDEFRVFYSDVNPKEVINVGFNTGSLTTFVGYNPSYKIYDIDADTFEVLDYEQWTYNLTEANLQPNRSPRWFKQYSFLDAYSLERLSLDNVGALVERLQTNNTLAYQYFKYQVRDSDAYLAMGCEDRCLKQRLCRITSIEQEDSNKCFDL